MASRPTKAASGQRKAAAKPAANAAEMPVVETIAAKRKAGIDAKSKAGKKPTVKTKAETIADKEIRKARILDLAMLGSTVRQISERLTADKLTGVSKSSVHNLLTEALDDAKKENLEKAEHLLQLELEKIKKLEIAIMPNMVRIADIDRRVLQKLTAGEVDPVAAVMLMDKLQSDHFEKYSRSLERLHRRYDQLTGIAKPQKVEHSGENGGPIETAIRVILPKLPDDNPEE